MGHTPYSHLHPARVSCECCRALVDGANLIGGDGAGGTATPTAKDLWNCGLRSCSGQCGFATFLCLELKGSQTGGHDGEYGAQGRLSQGSVLLSYSCASPSRGCLTTTRLPQPRDCSVPQQSQDTFPPLTSITTAGRVIGARSSSTSCVAVSRLFPQSDQRFFSFQR